MDYAPSEMIATWLAPSVLLIVAAYQRVRVLTVNQCPWKGGGFGMFSDIQKNVILAMLTVPTSHGHRQVLWKPGARAEVARRTPTPRHLRQVATMILSGRWLVQGDAAMPYYSEAGLPPTQVHSVTILFLQEDFDSRRGVHSIVLRDSVTVTNGLESASNA